MRLLSILSLTLLLTGNVYAGTCRTSYDIYYKADDVRLNAQRLAQDIRYTFGHIRLVDDVQNVKRGAGHLSRLAYDGSYSCRMLKANFSNLLRRYQTLRDSFRSFSRRRSVSRVAREWRTFVDSFESLRRTMDRTRDTYPSYRIDFR